MGQSIGLKELVATLVVSGVLLIVGTVVFAHVKDSLDSDLLENADNTSTQAGETVSNVEDTAYGAFELATVALIVLAASVIIGILIRAFGT